MRRVILVCGPPGAGKSTLARRLAAADRLIVLDRDDGWDESRFQSALRSLGRSPRARAVVIRTGATAAARTAAAATVLATDVRVLATPLAVCIDRIKRRGRRNPPVSAQIKAATRWWATFEREARMTTTERGYGAAHQQLRRRWARRVEAGSVRCARCGEPIIPGTPWDLGHDDDDRNRYAGPEHRHCNRRTAAHRVERRTRHSRRW